jgi:lipopolysaccharide transport system ATP-binding protein
MTVRLGFAVAAFLEPEILVVDEVLAVGDAEFQKKAIGKMQDISSQEGRTVLFVSHNLNSILQLCNNTILFDKGMVKAYDNTKVVLEKYLADSENEGFHRIGSKNIEFTKYELLQESVTLSDDLTVNLTLKCNSIVDKIDISLDIRNENFEFVAHVNNHDALFYIDHLIKEKDTLEIQVIVRNINLAPGLYYISLWTGDNYNNWFDYIENCLKFRVYQGTDFIKRPFAYDPRSKVVLKSDWIL